MFIRAKNTLVARTKDGRSYIMPGETAEVDDETGRELIELKAATEIARPVAQDTIPAAPDPVPGENPTEEEKAAEGGNFAETEGMTYTTAMSVSALRAAMRENGFTVRVNMTKKEMVDTLNGDTLPELSAQDVVDE